MEDNAEIAGTAGTIDTPAQTNPALAVVDASQASEATTAADSVSVTESPIADGAAPESVPVAAEAIPSPPPPERRTRRVRARRKHLRPKPDTCPNCGYPCAEEHNYCPRCGQDHGSHALSMTEMFRDVWDEFARIDSALLKTIFPLLLHPGLLTREYLDGRRIRYIAPFKLYLAVSFIVFTALAWRAQVNVSRTLAEGQASLSRQVAREKQEAAEARATGKSQAALSRTRRLEGKGADVEFDTGGLDLANLPDTMDAYQAQQNGLPASKRDSRPKQFLKCILIRFRAGDTGSLIGGVLDAASKMMFFLLPVYALLLQIFYARSKRLYVEHFVYSLHLHTVFFLYLLVMILVPVPGVKSVLQLVFAIYSTMALKRVYGQGLLKTLLKSALIAGVYGFVLFLTLTVTLLLSLAAQSGFLAAQRSML